MKILVVIAMLLAGVPLARANEAKASKAWQAWIVPASLNADRTIRLIGGHVQLLPLLLQANDAIKAKSNTQKITLELDLPAGMSSLSTAGQFKVLKSESAPGQDGRQAWRYEVEAANADLIGPRTEWQTQNFYVQVPDSIPEAQSFVELRLNDGTTTQSWRWPLTITSLQPAARYPKQTTIGLWDYNYRCAVEAGTCDGIAAFLADSGVSFTEDAPAGAYLAAIKAHGIVSGGNTHHDLFYSSTARDEDAAGQLSTGGYAAAEDIIELPPGATIPGVKQLVEFARAGSGIATFDYEPAGWGGFGAKAVARFKREHHVSDADFKIFREYVAKHGDQSFKATDPLVSSLWKKWTAFRSAQVAGYVKRIHEAFKSQYPDGQLAVTPHRSFGADTIGTHAIGCDNSVIASHCDIIMPQIYSGYGGINVKLAMQYTAGWRQTLAERGDKAKLWPILLVRYAGAQPANSPQRLHQQILGALASGAQGFLLYFPGMMDAPYWQMLARTTEEISTYEEFYQQGQRVEGEYKADGMPMGRGQVILWPGYAQNVENQQWAMTAHRLDKKVLLTLFNLEEANDLVFRIDRPDMQVSQSQNVSAEGKQAWLVGPQQVGFVVIQEP
ncbi:MAG: hypothetical protein IT446_08340 [Phycisphaerales bacterium]|nr:hypothetical protein [Phycisphaerales bacterium]